MTKTNATRIDDPHPGSKDAHTVRRAVLYQRWVARTSRPLDILALVFLIDFLLGRVAPTGPEWWQPGLGVVSFVIWLAFAIDYLVRLSLSPERSTFFRTHKLDLVMVLLPMLRMLRVLLLLRKSFKSIPTEKIAGSLFSIVIGVVALGAVLEWQVERDAPGANITTLGTAFWWAITTTTTVGYGDTYPVTTAGRLIASCVMVVGIGLIGTVSATVAAWFVSHNQKMAEKARADKAGGGTTADPTLADGPGPQSAEDALRIDGDPSATTPAQAPDLGTTLAALSAQIEVLSSQQLHLQATLDRLTSWSTG